jgi:hypothetical protein
MKFMQSVTGRLMVWSASLAVVGLISSAQAQIEQGKAEVTAIQGTAEYSTDGGAFMPLKAGTILRTGSQVRTGGGSHADLYFGKNNGVVRVSESTTLALDKLTFSDTGLDMVIDTQLNLKEGHLLGNASAKMAPASKYEIKTPNGVAGIRGTKYDIYVCRVAVVEGKVYFVHFAPGGQNVPYVVTARNQFDCVTGLTPLPEAVYDSLKKEIDSMVRGGPAEVISVPPFIEPFASPILKAE